MPNPSVSDIVFLPFGSLTGVIPIDAVPQGRVLGDFGSVVAGQDHRPAERRVAVVAQSYPACARWSPSLEKGDSGI